MMGELVPLLAHVAKNCKFDVDPLQEEIVPFSGQSPEVQVASKVHLTQEADTLDLFGNNNRWRSGHHPATKNGLFFGKSSPD
jgi:hypothetical protein